MRQLEQRHIEFLQVCAKEPNKIHPQPAAISTDDMQQMVAEGLLVPYNKPTGRHYAIGRYGAQYVKETYVSPESYEAAIQYAMSKGLSEDEAKTVVEREGAEGILKVRNAEHQASTQREVTIPIDQFGRQEIKQKG